MTTLSPGPALKSTAASQLGDLAPSSRRRSGADGDVPLNSERSFGDEISSALAQTSAGREAAPAPANDPASASMASTPSDVGSLPSTPLAGQAFLPAFGLSAPTTPATLGVTGGVESSGLDGSASSAITGATPGGSAELGAGVGSLLGQTEAALDLTGPSTAVGDALLGAPLGTPLETAPETTATAAGTLHPQTAEPGAAGASEVAEAADGLGRTAFTAGTDLGAGSEGSQNRPDTTSRGMANSATASTSSTLSAPATSLGASPSDPTKTPGTGSTQATQLTLPASAPEPSLPAAAAATASTTAPGIGDAAPSPSAPASPTTSAVTPITPVTSPSAVPPTPLTTHNPAEVRPAVVATQVAAEISRFTATATPGTHRISIALSPEALGDVRVTLVVRSGNLQVHLAAETAAARTALTSGSPELARLLESVGAPDARVVVRDMSGGSAERSPSQSFSHTSADSGTPGNSREAPDQADRDRSGPTRPDRLTSDPTLDRATSLTDLAAARPATAGGSHLDQLI